MQIWIYTLSSALIISLVSLVGVVTLFVKQETVKKLSVFLVGLAVGALLGNAFIHLIPESFEKLGHHISTSLYILMGVLLFFVLEKFVRWRHCHVSDLKEHAHPMVTMNLVGGGVHNFIDGMLIAASYQGGISLGIATTLAILFHAIPQKTSDFGVLIYGGFSIPKALLVNFLIALTAVLGAIFVLSLPGSLSLSYILMAITAGTFLYIAGSDLVPELHHEVAVSTSLLQLLSIVMGIGIMVLLAMGKTHGH